MTSKTNLDLRSQTVFSTRDAVRYDDIAAEIAGEYSQISEQICGLNNLKDSAMLLSPALRKTKGLYDLCVRTVLLEEKLEEKHRYKLILVDDQPTADIFRQVVNKYGSAETVISPEPREHWLITIIFCQILSTIKYILISWLCFRLFCRLKKPQLPIRLVDTFLSPESFDPAGVLKERYYPGYESHFSETERSSIWFSPTLLHADRFRDCFRICRHLDETKTPFLVQEKWLNWSDWLNAFVVSFWLPSKVKQIPSFRGYELSSFIKQEKLLDIGSTGLVKAISKYRFVRRLKLENVQIEGVVDWYENQAIDRALILAIRRYYPNKKIFGYQGFASPTAQIQKDPTTFEVDSGVVPDALYVIGPTFVLQKKRFAAELDVRVGPAFRFQYLFDKVCTPSHERKIVLIPLPIYLPESQMVLKACLEIQKSLPKQTRFLVKSHPAVRKWQLRKEAPEYFDNIFEESEESLQTLIEIASVVISSESSICVEAAALGVPVAVIGNLTGLTMNPLLSECDATSGVFYMCKPLAEFVHQAVESNERVSTVKDLFHAVREKEVRELFFFHSNTTQ